jgi:hypothetical protein
VRTQSVGERPVRNAAWLDDRQLVVETAQSFFTRLWSTDVATSTWTPLTKEFTALSDFSATSDRRTAVATRNQRQNAIWLGDGPGENLRVRVPDNAAGPAFPFLDDSGTLFYSALLSDGGFGIYRLTAGDTQPTLITNMLVAPNAWSASRDGKVVVFVSNEASAPIRLVGGRASPRALSRQVPERHGPDQRASIRAGSRVSAHLCRCTPI